MKIQDILNAFREVLNKAKTFDEMQLNAEQFLFNTLTEFERDLLEEVKSFQVQIDMDSPSGRKTISVIPVIAIENELEN